MSDVDLPLWLDFLFIAGAIAGSLGVLAGFMLKTGRGVRWIGDAVREGVAEVAREQAAEIGQIAKRRDDDLRSQFESDNAELSAALDEVRAEVKPNGGASMRDVIDRVEAKLDDHIECSSDDRRELWAAVKDIQQDC